MGQYTLAIRTITEHAFSTALTMYDYCKVAGWCVYEDLHHIPICSVVQHCLYSTRSVSKMCLSLRMHDMLRALLSKFAPLRVLCAYTARPCAVGRQARSARAKGARAGKVPPRGRAGTPSAAAAAEGPRKGVLRVPVVLLCQEVIQRWGADGSEAGRSMVSLLSSPRLLTVSSCIPELSRIDLYPVAPAA